MMRRIIEPTKTEERAMITQRLSIVAASIQSLDKSNEKKGCTHNEKYSDR